MTAKPYRWHNDNSPDTTSCFYNKYARPGFVASGYFATAKASVSLTDNNLDTPSPPIVTP